VAGEWLRSQGIGRERFAIALQDFLKDAGFDFTTEDRGEEGTVITAQLRRPNPALPGSMHQLAFRLRPTGGGALLRWEAPVEIVAAERGGVDRFVREMRLQLERTVRTESHGTAKVVAPESGELPWVRPTSSSGSPPL
jgi:hypothetical protein